MKKEDDLTILIPIFLLVLLLLTGCVTSSTQSFIPRDRAGCGSNVVSIKYIGTPGLVFIHESRIYSIPPSGWVELISHSKGKLPVQTDAFGMMVVHLSDKIPTSVGTYSPSE